MPNQDLQNYIEKSRQTGKLSRYFYFIKVASLSALFIHFSISYLIDSAFSTDWFYSFLSFTSDYYKYIFIEPDIPSIIISILVGIYIGFIALKSKSK